MQCMGYLNEQIILRDKGRVKLKLPDMFRFLAVFIFSHTTGLSNKKTLEVLRSLGCSTPKLEDVRYISSNILAYSITGRGNEGLSSWNSQRDQTPLLSSFEETAFKMTAKIFMAPKHLFATLDDDLYGTRAADNQVKTLSARKADREGHVADSLADAFFRLTLALRFRRRGESQAQNVDSLLSNLLAVRGEKSLLGFVITADRGYGKFSLLKRLLKRGIGAMMIMPDHVLKCHHFVGQSFFDVSRNEMDSESESSSGSDGIGEGELPGEASCSERIAECNSSVAVDETHTFSTVFDRPKKFIVEDGPDAGPSAKMAKNIYVLHEMVLEELWLLLL